MKKIKYVFNTQTLQYDKYESSVKHRILKFIGLFGSIGFSALILMLVYSHFFPSIKEKTQAKEIAQMQFYLSKMNNDFAELSNKINTLQDKDAEVHRMIFGIDPIDEGVWEGGKGGSVQMLQSIENYEANEVLDKLKSKVDKIKRKVVIQDESLDSLLLLSIEHEKKLASIPSIKPVREDELKRKIKYLSGYGIRIHPIHKVKKFHSGIDFTAPKGTAIQATGNGRVIRVQNRKSGYGKNVIIDHGYGYETLYAHMDEIIVKKGQKVKKGQQIGTIGSSGTSTAPHLHYEVRINDKTVNPIDFVLDGLTPEAYAELVKRSSIENQSFD